MDLRGSVLVDALARVFEELEQEEADYRTDLALDFDVNPLNPPPDFWYRWRAMYVVRRLLGA